MIIITGMMIMVVLMMIVKLNNDNSGEDNDNFTQYRSIPRLKKKVTICVTY